MSKKSQMFVNLPVKNLVQSKAFYKAVGFTLNMQFSDETSACMVLSDTIHVMLLTHPKWALFTSKTISNAKETAQVMLCISQNSKKDVDSMVEAGSKAGGKADPNKSQDHGFMYSRSLEDPDGHIWEPMWMDLSAKPK